MKSIKGARTCRSILATQTFFWPLTPPPRYTINQPLSKGLGGVQGGLTPLLLRCTAILILPWAGG